MESWFYSTMQCGSFVNCHVCKVLKSFSSFVERERDTGVGKGQTRVSCVAHTRTNTHKHTLTNHGKNVRSITGLIVWILSVVFACQCSCTSQAEICAESVQDHGASYVRGLKEFF